MSQNDKAQITNQFVQYIFHVTMISNACVIITFSTTDNKIEFRAIILNSNMEYNFFFLDFGKLSKFKNIYLRNQSHFVSSMTSNVMKSQIPNSILNIMMVK